MPPALKPGSQGTPAAEIAAKLKTWVDLARSSMPDSMVKTLGEMVLGAVPTDLSDPQMADLTVPLMPPAIGMATRGAVRAAKKAGTLGQAAVKPVAEGTLGAAVTRPSMRAYRDLAGTSRQVGDLEFVNKGNKRFEINKDGKVVAVAELADDGDYLSSVVVDKKNRRQGVATKLYDLVEQEIGRPLQPSPISQTPEMQAFWQKRGAAHSEGTLGAALNRIPNPITAYHGSPHDFDQFSLSKIGTGEGAQAYGHGLYFAEKEDIAKAYRENLASPTVKIGDKTIQANGDDRAIEIALAHIEDATLKGSNAPFSDAAKSVMALATETKNPDRRQIFEDATQRLIEWQRKGAIVENGGRTYEVNIHATPDELLDWDKTLSEQPQKVREALGPMTGETAGDAYVSNARNFPPQVMDELQQMAARGEVTPTGRGQQLMAEYLKAKGIKGIQYLDQGSRAAGTGTRNFVIFDDQLIEIKRKFGFATTAAAAEWVRQNGGVVESRHDE